MAEVLNAANAGRTRIGYGARVGGAPKGQAPPGNFLRRVGFERIVAALDAIYATHRLRTHGVRTDRIPAFNVTFAVD